MKPGWSPARIFLAVSTVVHLVLGLSGFLYELTFPIGPTAVAGAPSEFVFGVFETNGWHTFLALVVAAASLYFTVRPRRAREAALGIGASQVGVWAALLVVDPSMFWIASNAADQVVHVSTGMAGIATALMTPKEDGSAVIAKGA